jgi:hypothetical protein
MKMTHLLLLVALMAAGLSNETYANEGSGNPTPRNLIYPTEISSVLSDNSPSDSINDEQAVEIARKACEGKIRIPPDAPAEIRSNNGVIIVSFMQTPIPGALHGDFFARVIINAVTGEVIEVAGPQ